MLFGKMNLKKIKKEQEPPFRLTFAWQTCLLARTRIANGREGERERERGGERKCVCERESERGDLRKYQKV